MFANAYHSFVICFHLWFYIFTVCDLFIWCSFISQTYLTFVSCCICSVCVCVCGFTLFSICILLWILKKEYTFISKIMFWISSLPDILCLFPCKLNLLGWYTDTFFPPLFQEAVISRKGNKVFIFASCVFNYHLICCIWKVTIYQVSKKF